MCHIWLPGGIGVIWDLGQQSVVGTIWASGSFESGIPTVSEMSFRDWNPLVPLLPCDTKTSWGIGLPYLKNLCFLNWRFCIPCPNYESFSTQRDILLGSSSKNKDMSSKYLIALKQMRENTNRENLKKTKNCSGMITSNNKGQPRDGKMATKPLGSEDCPPPQKIILTNPKPSCSNNKSRKSIGNKRKLTSK